MRVSGPVIAAGRRHSLGVRADGTVAAAGAGTAGELRVKDWADVVAVAAGSVHAAPNTGQSHSVGLRADRTVIATGWNGDGQCAVDHATTPPPCWNGPVGGLSSGRRSWMPRVDVIEELGHEPNGYFWEGIAQLLVDVEAPHLRQRFDYDPEGGMFVAHGSDRPALEELSALLTAVATDAERIRRLVALAAQRGVCGPRRSPATTPVRPPGRHSFHTA